MKKAVVTLLVLVADRRKWLRVLSIQQGRARADRHRGADHSRRHCRQGRGYRYAAGGHNGPGRDAGVRHHPESVRGLQLDRQEGTGPGPTGPVALPNPNRAGARQPHPVASRPRPPESRVSTTHERSWREPRSCPTASCFREASWKPLTVRRAVGGGADPLSRGSGHAGAGVVEPEPGQPGAHGHRGADRRARHLAQCRRRPDRGREHAGPDVVRARRRPDEDAGRREPRRVGCRTDPPWSARLVPRGCVSGRRLHRHRGAGQAAANRAAERRDVRNGD